jgi:hypothetical protein
LPISQSTAPSEREHRGVRILHTKKVPILDADGNPAYLLGISEDITERRRIEREQQFLDEVSVALSASIEYEQTLANLVRLVVQNFADWSAVDVINEEGQLSRLKVASADPAKAALCGVLEQMPPDRDLPHVMRSLIESKRPIVVEQVTLQYVESLVQAPGHLQALLATGVTSFVAVPLLLRGEPLGALFLGSSTLTRVLGQGDLRLAEALADRAAKLTERQHTRPFPWIFLAAAKYACSAGSCFSETDSLSTQYIGEGYEMNWRDLHSPTPGHCRASHRKSTQALQPR